MRLLLARHGEFHPFGPMLGIILLGLLVAGVPALVGTILAASALRDTGRAAGQLKGRGLALCAALFWPLLLTDIVLLSFAVFVSARAFGRSGHVVMAIITVLAALMVVTGLDWLVASRAWRWTDRSAAPVRSWLAPPVLACVLLVISPPALLLAGNGVALYQCADIAGAQALVREVSSQNDVLVHVEAHGITPGTL